MLLLVVVVVVGVVRTVGAVVIVVAVVSSKFDDFDLFVFLFCCRHHRIHAQSKLQLPTAASLDNFSVVG